MNLHLTSLLGAHIVPTFFFGNSSILKVVGAESGSKSWISKLSRKFKASIMMFYGRHGEILLHFILCFQSHIHDIPHICHISVLTIEPSGLPVPFRQPLRMVTGEIVLIKKNESPSDEEINEVMERVIKAVNDLYETKKPEWEKRPLKIT